MVYSGDATHDSLTQTGEFTIAYLFKDDIPSENPLKENYDITITLPADARGTVRLTVNNKPYTSQVKDGKASFKVDNLTFGAHEVFIEYIGDDYPYSSYNTLLNISYYEIMGEYSADAKFVSLMLPANATGNLTVVNTNVRNGKYDLFSVPISVDITKIDLSALPVGIYDLLAYYDGSDYEVRSFVTSFKVMPNVIIAQDTVIGENLTIFVDLNNSTGSLLIVLDGLSPVLEQIIEGKINYTMSTEGYSYGNHSVTFYYVGTSFDGNVFNELNTATGYSDPIKYGVEI
ncbi:MAG: Ig-like domain repeat protein, partial [Methanobrevibacter sp.]|nr:Ig-like domain repeat protein [Methanobrevibacter sp.]